MSFKSLCPSGGGHRIQEPPTAPAPPPVRQMDAPAAYRVDFYLISVALGVAGFKMSWTTRSRNPGRCASAGAASLVTDEMNDGGRTGTHARPIADDDRNSATDLRLVREFSTVLTSSAATRVIEWTLVTPNSMAEPIG